MMVTELPTISSLDILYISYDGLMEPLGRSQVASYMMSLASGGLRVAIISFEKPDDYDDRAEREQMLAELKVHGISWVPLPYHRRPRLLATVLDIVNGIVTATRLARRSRPSIVHGRSYVAGLMALTVKMLAGARFVFDMRGFWPEERVELGLFRPRGGLYRSAKITEKILFDASDHIVVLTESAKAILRDREAIKRLAYGSTREKPISVVPCCVDLDRYRPLSADKELAREHGLDSAIVIGNIGAFNRRYMTFEMFRFAFHVKRRRPGVRFVYLTEQEASAVRRAARDAGLNDEDSLVLRSEPRDIPRWLSLYRLGIFFLRPSYAAKASSFTKLGEFLAAGVPVVTNTGVGDVDRILGTNHCGLVVPGLTDRELENCAEKALVLLEGDEVPEETRHACRMTAVEHFALAAGVDRYRGIYESLLPVARPKEGSAFSTEIG